MGILQMASSMFSVKTQGLTYSITHAATDHFGV